MTIKLPTDAQASWITNWPHYCRTCEGWGRLTWEENQAPIGSGQRWMEPLIQECDDCIGQGRCPRCGQEDCFDGTSWDICPSCGWDANNPDALPPSEDDPSMHHEEPLPPEDLPNET